MSASEAADVFFQLERINNILTTIEMQAQNLERQQPQLEEGVMTLQQFTRTLYRMNHLLAHMGLPKEIKGAIHILQQLVFMSRMALMSMSLLAKATPYGMVFGAMGVASIFFSTSDLVMQLGE